ncbi:hypothetical protein SteCoe_18686 [Stentor coeruleus]|uniref:Centrosomal protein POC5 n=1 Tax=Stentor coeruleus TaxID=5963 RepID=A0A1R2BWF1_9CILI|nr:hypothetical protein SteCoe_18686 [Stentor coeruleus]
MFTKKTPAARISDLNISDDFLSEADLINSETSPTSKDTKPEPSLPISESDTIPPQVRMRKDEVHHPQVIDQDVENFTTRLDTLITQFRNESLKEFLTAKRTILHEQISTIESEKKRCNALLSSKQDEIEHLKENLEKTSKTNLKNESQKEALALTVGMLKLQKSATYILNKAYISWYKYHSKQQHKKQTKNLMKKLHRKAIINYTFIPWKQVWRVFHQNKGQKLFYEKLEAEKSQLSMHYNKEIEILKTRLYDAERRVAVEEEEKTSMQENLKKAFMRGVCAMNFEAMNILNPGSLTETYSYNENSRNEPLRMEPIKSEQASEIVQRTERYEKFDNEKSQIEEISNMIPSESKELRWKAAPVFGKSVTAPEKPETMTFSGIPSIPVTNSQGEGKVIIVNNVKGAEAKITGKVPLKPAIGKKGMK